MNFGLKSLFHPTPEGVKSVADSVLYGIGGLGGGAAYATNHPQLGLSLFIIGIVARVVSNFFSDKKVE